jgi:hypothetical protein
MSATFRFLMKKQKEENKILLVVVLTMAERADILRNALLNILEKYHETTSGCKN